MFIYMYLLIIIKHVAFHAIKHFIVNFFLVSLVSLTISSSFPGADPEGGGFQGFETKSFHFQGEFSEKLMKNQVKKTNGTPLCKFEPLNMKSSVLQIYIGKCSKISNTSLSLLK